MAVISEVRPKTPFWHKLQKDECKSVQKFYKHTDKIMRQKPIEKLCRQRSQLPQRKITTTIRSRRMEIVVHLWTR